MCSDLGLLAVASGGALRAQTRTQQGRVPGLRGPRVSGPGVGPRGTTAHTRGAQRVGRPGRTGALWEGEPPGLLWWAGMAVCPPGGGWDLWGGRPGAGVKEARPRQKTAAGLVRAFRPAGVRGLARARSRARSRAPPRDPAPGARGRGRGLGLAHCACGEGRGAFRPGSGCSLCACG